MKQLKPRPGNLFTFLFIIILAMCFFIWLVRLLIKQPLGFTVAESVFVYSGLVLMLIFPIILSCWYLYVDLTKKVIIDEKNKKIIIRKRGKDLIITQNDILDACIIQAKSGSRSLFPLYKYVILVLRERRRIFITNLLCEPEYILNILGLKMNVLEYSIPYLDFSFGNGLSTTKEFELKVLEYEDLFQDHTDKMLNDIILHKEVYADYAIEAAKRILKKRK